MTVSGGGASTCTVLCSACGKRVAFNAGLGAWEHIDLKNPCDSVIRPVAGEAR